jgi:CDP-diacylglycerol--serine O-phosphatidyltransferase
MESAQYMANIITTANLLFGAMSILLAVIGKYIPAAWIIFFSVIFDIADGKIARMGNNLSAFGKQFDSLADLISFVIAPAVLIFTLNRPEFFLWRLLVCLIVIFCGAFRLARFNIEAEEKLAHYFNGLPSPGFGMVCASFVLVYYHYNLMIEPRVISIIVAVLAVLMVSQIKYPTYKDVSLFHWRYLLGLAVILPMLFIVPELTVLVISLIYLIVIPITSIKLKQMKKGAKR